MQINEIEKTEEQLEKENLHLEELSRLRAYEGDDRVVFIGDLVNELKEKRSQERIYSSPFRDLDAIIGGFRPGQLVVISGPTGHGKTTVSKSFTAKLHQDGIESVWFSYEMAPIEFVENYPDTPHFYVPMELPTGRLDWIDQKIGEAIAKYGVGAAFIDHLHYLVDLKALSAARNQSILIGILLRQLKSIAVKYNIVLFLIAHIRKLALEDSVPTIDDLRDSSFVGQEADIVLMTWKKKAKDEFGKDISKRDEPIVWSNEACISVVKNRRTGSTGVIKVVYNVNTNQYNEPF